MTYHGYWFTNHDEIHSVYARWETITRKLYHLIQLRNNFIFDDTKAKIANDYRKTGFESGIRRAIAIALSQDATAVVIELQKYLTEEETDRQFTEAQSC